MDDRTVRAIFPNGFLPLINTHIWDGSAAGGVRGKFRGWNWDLSNVFGLNTFQFMVRQSANVSLGAASPTSFDAGRLKFDQYTANLDLVRPFDVGLASPLNVAFGAEFRRDHYGIDAGEPDSYRDGGVKILDGPNAGTQPQVGAQVFPGFKPSDEQNASRNNVAGYVDLETNLTQKLLLGVAGRTEHYSDFGSTTNGKVTARFELQPGLAFRGAVSTGYRAPSLGQSYFSSTATNFIVVGGVNTPFDIRTFPVGSPEAQILGAEPLRPEKSFNLSGGISLQPFRAMSLTADYYRIDIKDRIVFSGNFIGADIQALLEARGFFGVRGGRYFTNAIDTRTDGVDVVLQRAFDLGSIGTSRFTGSYNHSKTILEHVDATPPQLGNRQEVLFDRVERARITEGQPRDNVHFMLDHTRSALGINLVASRYGEVTARGTATDGSADQTFGAKWITDVAASYGLTRRFRVTIGADNVFDVYPDKNIPVNSNAGIFPYSGISPFGFNGAYYYFRLTQQF
jgi:iron complex outermembrane recepter protein